VRLLESAEAVTPMLTGVLKPMIVLPARVITGLGSAEIEAILAHELAHLARHDTWSNLLQVIIETILFYHPAIWWASERRGRSASTPPTTWLCVSAVIAGFTPVPSSSSPKSALLQPLHSLPLEGIC